MSAPNGPSIEEIFDFYDRRGYRHRIGGGKHPAVVVIDFSNAFTNSRNDFPGGDFAEEIRQTRRILDVARSKGVPIFFTTIAYDNPEEEAGLWGKKVPWLVQCRMGTPAVDIDNALGARAEEIIVKRFPSAFFGTHLHAQLSSRGIDTIVLAGCTTSVCVRATAVDAMQHGYRALVVAEAVGEFDRSLHAVHLRDMDARYADVVSIEDVLGYLTAISPPGR